MSVVIKGDRGSVEIELEHVDGVLSPNSHDRWVTVKICVYVSPFSGAFSVDTSSLSFDVFAEGLSRVLESMDGNATLNTIGDEIEVKIIMMRLGKAVLKGRIKLVSGPRVMLGFEFETDQSYLQETLNQVSKFRREIEDRIG